MRILAFIVLIILFFGFLEILFLRLFAKEWWKNKTIRKISWSLPLIGLFGTLLWFLGVDYNIGIIMYAGAIITAIVFVTELCLTFSLPFSGFVHFINFLIEKFQNKSESEISTVDINRRKILLSTAAAIPLISLSSGVAGVVQTFSSVDVFLKPIKFAGLPDDLNGFRILHLSDLHLRHYVTLTDLEDVLIQAEKFSPDMILMTGDIADDLQLLPDALNLIEQFNAPFGSYASLGNHEHFRGIEQVLRIFEKSPIPLFVNESITSQVGKSSLFIGGIDDPVRMGAKEMQFYKHTIDKTLLKEKNADFKILMSHRPDALDYAAQTGINLTLAGHTHGGQMGINGRSVLESYFPDRYLWGDYSIGESKLYTTSGMGHWFPFRLGCPTEAPVIELVKS